MNTRSCQLFFGRGDLAGQLLLLILERVPEKSGVFALEIRLALP